MDTLPFGIPEVSDCLYEEHEEDSHPIEHSSS